MSDQQTLTGASAPDRPRPSTMLWCPDCDDWILRSKRRDHPHELFDPEDHD